MASTTAAGCSGSKAWLALRDHRDADTIAELVP